jgi:hypothetical protein
MTASAAFFRVAQEGTTVDKRQIKREWLEQMAANYDPKRYGARVFMEHKRGVIPDGPFKAYGDVLALKTQEEPNGKTALYAQIQPLPEMIELIKARQKVYASIEVDPNFANSKSAYLVGLGITDSPASLGTEPLFFTVSREPQMHSIVSEPVEMEPEAADASQRAYFSLEEAPSQITPSVFCKVKSLLGFSASSTTFVQQKAFEDLTHAVETLAAHAHTQSTQQRQLQEELEALKQSLSATSENASPRPIATGMYSTHLTDC